jgi:cell division protein FtsI (penicillin-binding protein 3)
MERIGTAPTVPAPRGAPPREAQVRLRLMLTALSVTLWALCLVVRLAHLQVLERGTFERLAARQSERTVTIEARRGPILDRNGRELALSVDAESLYAVPQDVSDPDATAAELARALRLDPKERKDLQAQLRKNRAFVWVKRKLDPLTAGAVRALQLEGIGFLPETRRYYPRRELAAQVLGYTGLDNAGMSGVEYGFDEQIRGRAAKVVVRTDARRRPVGHTEKPSTEGHTVVLTLDERIQHVAERELRRAVAETRSLSGVAVVMEPHTGEILAMASEPSFNPNSFADYPSSRWVNRAVADAYEPGSIFKIITAAAGLQEKVVTPDEVIDCGGGAMEIAGVRVRDHDVFFKLSFRDVIARSSDVGVARVAQRVGRRQFDRYLRDFGFGAPTGVALPGEAKGLLRPVEKWSDLSLPILAFGQEIGVTALQMTSAAAVVANGGYRMRPLIVSRVEDRDGRAVKVYHPEAAQRVLEPRTIDTLMELLKEVVRDGTGRRAAIPGYVVAGKTGTAQKVKPGGGYSMEDHVASFVGIVPASRPALVALVSLDSPRGALNQGGHVAAPLFAAIAEPALRLLGVPPDDPARVMRMTPATDVLRVSYPGAGSVPPDAAPAPLPAPPPAGEPALMPDLRGRSARDAAVIAARFGLTLELSGSGQVVAQTPEPGVELEGGTTCVLTLARTPAPPPSVREPRPVAGAVPPSASAEGAPSTLPAPTVPAAALPAQTPAAPARLAREVPS